jgi:hypothetical protein
MRTCDQPLQRCADQTDVRVGLLVIATMLAGLAVVPCQAPLRAGAATGVQRDNRRVSLDDALASLQPAGLVGRGVLCVAGAPEGSTRAALRAGRRTSTPTRSRFERIPPDADVDPADTDDEDGDERRLHGVSRSGVPSHALRRFAAWKMHPPGRAGDHCGQRQATYLAIDDSRNLHVTGRAHRPAAHRSIGEADSDGDGDGDADGAFDTVSLIHSRTALPPGSILPGDFLPSRRISRFTHTSIRAGHRGLPASYTSATTSVAFPPIRKGSLLPRAQRASKGRHVSRTVLEE